MRKMLRMIAVLAIVGCLSICTPVCALAGSVKTIKVGEVCTDTTSTTDDYDPQTYHENYYDTFKFTVSKKGLFTMELKSTDRDLFTSVEFKVYNANGYEVRFIVSPEDDPESGGYIGHFYGSGYFPTILDKGTYYLAAQFEKDYTEKADGTTYKFKINIDPTETKVETTSIKKLTAKSKGFKVEWKKTDSSGYQIQYATDKNFKKGKKTVKIASGNTTVKTISKLKSKKKYYVRVRAYKTSDGKNSYSAWSGVKTVKTK